MNQAETANTTSFAEKTLCATALILDALAETGTVRRIKLTHAQTLLYDACAGADGATETALVTALVDVVKGYERTGADR